MEKTCDVAVVGGGPIGAALAAMVAGSGLKTLVLEAREQIGAGDTRTLALSYASRLILERLGAWDRVGTATEIHSIHVSHRGGFGRTQLSAQDTGMPALGYVIPHSQVTHALIDASQAAGAIVHVGAQVTDILVGSDHVDVGIQRKGERHGLQARLLVIADGGVNKGLDVGTESRLHPYAQHAVVGNVRSTIFHAQRAFERFTPEGPVALLPSGSEYALVWTAAPASAQRLMGLSDENFLACLQTHFGDRAGQFLSIGPRAQFPLALRIAQHTVLPRRVLLGNAAQALHPIAGQGFNLGLRDAWELGESIFGQQNADPGSAACLSAYRKKRRIDRGVGIALTHSLVQVFSNDNAGLKIARGTGLAFLDLIPGARRAFTRRMVYGGPR